MAFFSVVGSFPKSFAGILYAFPWLVFHKAKISLIPLGGVLVTFSQGLG